MRHACIFLASYQGKMQCEDGISRPPHGREARLADRFHRTRKKNTQWLKRAWHHRNFEENGGIRVDPRARSLVRDIFTVCNKFKAAVAVAESGSERCKNARLLWRSNA